MTELFLAAQALCAIRRDDSLTSEQMSALLLYISNVPISDAAQQHDCYTDIISKKTSENIANFVIAQQSNRVHVGGFICLRADKQTTVFLPVSFVERVCGKQGLITANFESIKIRCVPSRLKGKIVSLNVYIQRNSNNVVYFFNQKIISRSQVEFEWQCIVEF